MKKLFIEIEAATGRHLTPEEQEDTHIMLKVVSTKCIEVNNKEEYEQYFKKHKKCKTHLIYDEPGFMYDSRYCDICGKFIALI